MASKNTTPIYGLPQLTLNDFYDIKDFNDGWSITETEIKKLHDKSGTNNNDIGALNTRVNTISTNVTALNTKITSNESDITSLKNKTNTIENGLHSAVHDLDDIKDDITDMKDDISTSSNLIVSLELVNNLQSAYIDTIVDTVNTHEKDINTGKTNLTNLTTVVANNHSATQANQSAISAVRKDLDAFIASGGNNVTVDLSELEEARVDSFGTNHGSLNGRLNYEFDIKADQGDLDLLENKVDTKLDKAGGTVTGNLTVSGDMAVGSKIIASQGSTANKQIFEMSSNLPYIYLGNADNTTIIESKGDACINDFNTKILTNKSGYTQEQIDSKIDKVTLDLHDLAMVSSNKDAELEGIINAYIPMFSYMLDVLVRHQIGLENIQEDFHSISELLGGHVIDRIKALEERLGITPPSTNPEDKPQRPVITWKHESWQETSPTIWFETSDIGWDIASHYNLTKAGLRESSGANQGVGGTWYQFNYGYANTTICVFKSDIPGFSDNLSNTVKINLFNNWWVSNVDWIG